MNTQQRTELIENFWAGQPARMTQRIPMTQAPEDNGGIMGMIRRWIQ